MKLVEIAGKLSEEQQTLITEHSVWSGIEGFAWPDSLFTSDCAHHAWRNLDQSARYALEVILLGFGQALFSEEQFLQAAKPRLAGSELRIGLLQLQEAGLVFALRKGWGEKLYAFPSDVYAVWHRAMLEEKRLSSVTKVDPYEIVPVDEYDGYVPPLSVQLLHAMAALQHAGMKRTAKGVLAKRAIESASSQLQYDSEQLLSIAELTQSDVAQPYPLPLALMLQLALQEGWLIERAATYHLNQSVWQAWLAQSAHIREATLLQRMVELLSSNSAAASVGASQLRAHLTAYTWYRVADVEDQLMQACSSVLAKPSHLTIAAWCRLLRSLGWIELAEDEAGTAVFRWLLDLDAQITVNSAPLQFTPDGDIYVQEDCPHTVRWQLELIAERRRTDRVTVYRMTERSYKRCAEQGMDSVKIIRMLDSAAEEPLPETMRAAIVIGMNAHETAVKPASDAAISVSLHGTNPIDNEPTLLVLQSGSASSYSSSPTYELIFERKAVRSLFAGIDSVPAMWLKQFRTYHHSTRRELMEQALSWRSAVKLSYEGEIKPFIPERIVDEEGKWAVVGHLQEGENCMSVKLLPDMWQEMMLMLPKGTLNY